MAVFACGSMPPRQRLPDLAAPEPAPEEVSFREHTAALRATLARSGIDLDGAGTIHSNETCTDHACLRCEVATGMDGVDADVIDRVAIAVSAYPEAFLSASAFEHVALCKALGHEDDQGEPPAGAADPTHRRLMVNVGYLVTSQNEREVEQVMHHELFHLFDILDIGADVEWAALVPPGFTYRDPADRSKPRPDGFITPYGTTNEREDRATIFEYLMARPEELCKVAADDPIVAAKTTLIWHRVATVVGDAFLRKAAPCVDWVEIGPRPPTRKYTHMR
jgi:hypothetical protein